VGRSLRVWAGAWCFLILGLGACGDAPEIPPEVTAYGLTVETARLAPTLRLFNFPDYLDPALIREFREMYGVRIIQDFFDTNESMMARLRAAGGAGGGFDVVVASDYAVGILVDEGMLQELDPALLPNRSGLHGLFTRLPFDPQGRFSVPYQWGTTGLGIRTDRVVGTEEDWATWGLLFDPARGVRFALLDDPRESIGAALLYLGYSVNSREPGEHALAELLLAQTRERAAAFTPATTGRDLLVAGELDVSHNHSGDVGQAAEEDERVTYVIPREGAVVWSDNMVIPRGSEAAYTAHVFMNFILDPAVGARLTNYSRYSSPNEASWTLLDDELREGMDALLDGELFDRLEFIEDLGDERRMFDEMWTRIKAGAGR
jgi:spermidine/putrescine transport system substrate-binding protein